MTELEYKLKKPVNTLICFSKAKTGDALGILANELLKARTDNSTITVLHLIDNERRAAIDNIEAYKSELFNNILTRCEGNNIPVRSFVKESDAFVNDILEMAEEQSSDLVLIGIGGHVFNSNAWKTYETLRSIHGNLDEEIYKQFEMPVARSLKNVSSLLDRNQTDTGIFVENRFEKMKRIFVPILDKNDVYIFRYLYKFMQSEGTEAMVWDAIGVLSTDAETHKVFHQIQRKTEGRISVWDNNRKIESDFIGMNDLVLIGIDGWNKLVTAALSWFPEMPSILIIKKEPTTT